VSLGSGMGSTCSSGVAEEVARRAEAEAADVQGALTAQATRTDRIKKALSPKLLFTRTRPTTSAEPDREPVGV
jgi:hypothetical protein